MLTEKTLNEIARNVLDSCELDLYFIMDGAAVKHWPEQVWPLHSQALGNVVSLFGQYGAAEHLDTAPYLISLTKADRLYKHIIEECRTEPLGIFLVTVKGWTNAYYEAQSWLWPKKQSGEQIYFRYYDPRIFTTLANYYQRSSDTMPMGSFAEVFWHDPVQEAVFHINTGELGQSFDLKNPWLLEPDLEEALGETYILHRLMAELKNIEPELTAEYSSPQFYRMVDFFVKDAASYNIYELKSLRRFCHMSLLFPEFTTHPETDRKLRSTKKSFSWDFNAFINSLPLSWLTPYRKQR